MRVLIATDGSNFSKAAVERACELLIKPAETSVRVVSAFEDTYPIAAEPFAVSADFYQHIIDAAQSQAEHFANEAADMIRSRFKGEAPEISTGVLRGSPEQQIVEEAKNWKADLIVVGSHGRGFWGRMLGSVSDAVVHHAPCSVVVVRDGNP
jgi:nucleotide-binding universal stress UspA family protein